MGQLWGQVTPLEAISLGPMRPAAAFRFLSAGPTTCFQAVRRARISSFRSAETTAKLFGGPAQGRRDGQRRCRRSVDQGGQIGAVRQPATPGLCRQAGGDTAPETDRQLDGSLLACFRRAMSSACVSGTGGLQRRNHCEPSDLRHRKVAGPGVRLERRAESAKIDGHALPRSGGHHGQQDLGSIRPVF
jgi:hypothetical protein